MFLSRYNHCSRSTGWFSKITRRVKGVFWFLLLIRWCRTSFIDFLSRPLVVVFRTSGDFVSYRCILCPPLWNGDGRVKGSTLVEFWSSLGKDVLFPFVLLGLLEAVEVSMYVRNVISEDVRNIPNSGRLPRGVSDVWLDRDLFLDYDTGREEKSRGWRTEYRGRRWRDMLEPLFT